MKRFPVVPAQRGEPDAPRSVPWDWVEKYERRIWMNHGQTLGDLSRAGGLDPVELFMAAFDLDVGAMYNVSIRTAVLWLSREPWKRPRGR